MSQYSPGDAWLKTFPTYDPSTGSSASADDDPVAEVRRNGVVDDAVVVTIDNTGLGLYVASATIPDTYADIDRFEVLVTATVGGVTATDVIESIRLKGGGDVINIDSESIRPQQ